MISSNITMLNVNDTMDMGSMSDMGDMPMSMSMVMTFGKWSDYKLQLIFSSWDIKTVPQYLFSCLFIIMMAVIWHGLRYFLVVVIEKNIRELIFNKKVNRIDENEYSTVNQNTSESPKVNSSRILLLGGKNSSTSMRIRFLSSLHALVSALTYGLALLLMLVAMTYNAGLFLSLLIGYFVGDLLFFTTGLYASPNISSAEQDCH